MIMRKAEDENKKRNDLMVDEGKQWRGDGGKWKGRGG